MANVLTGVARRTAAAPAARGRRPRSLLPRARRNGAAWGFLIGAVLCFSFFSWYPIVREVIMNEPPLWASWLVLFVICALCLWLLSRKVKAYEVVK